jgi:hypothetical protein
MRQTGAKWVYALPGVHLGACLIIWIARLVSGVHYLIYFDFPFSLILVMLGWRNDDFLFWFATLGTIWWFGLSYVGLRALNSLFGL